MMKRSWDAKDRPLYIGLHTKDRAHDSGPKTERVRVFQLPLSARFASCLFTVSDTQILERYYTKKADGMRPPQTVEQAAAILSSSLRMHVPLPSHLYKCEGSGQKTFQATVCPNAAEIRHVRPE